MAVCYLQVSVSTHGDEGESDVPSPVTIIITCPTCGTPSLSPKGAWPTYRYVCQLRRNRTVCLPSVFSVGFS